VSDCARQRGGRLQIVAVLAVLVQLRYNRVSMIEAVERKTSI